VRCDPALVVAWRKGLVERFVLDEQRLTADALGILASQIAFLKACRAKIA
jgi:hypothetical protein